MAAPEQHVKLHGFNNLTKSLAFNMYDICYTRIKDEREAYLEYIDEQYNAERLTAILKQVSDIIGAHVLNIAKQDYVPQGASVTILVSEGRGGGAEGVVCGIAGNCAARISRHVARQKPYYAFTRTPNIIRMTGSARSVPISTYPPAGKFPR